MIKVWIVGMVLLLSLAYYQLIARPLFQEDHSPGRLLRWVQSTAIVVWFQTQLQLMKGKVIPYTKQLYDKSALYRDTLKVIVNFLQIVGSFARHACMHASMHTRALTRPHAHTYARSHTHMHDACKYTDAHVLMHTHARACPLQVQTSFPRRV